MFVRWKKHKGYKGGIGIAGLAAFARQSKVDPDGAYAALQEAIKMFPATEYTIGEYAVLVESYRNDEGKPRQRFIAHLGAMPGDSTYALGMFWTGVIGKLGELDIGDAERHKIMTKLAERVPELTDDQVCEIAELVAARNDRWDVLLDVVNDADAARELTGIWPVVDRP